ncbi:MAG: hypothetical protein LKJ64_03860 [Lentilactobacillus buchneri]|nr:hypothetical protein [Lentilactobacillus buchneri]MCI2019705.1 hypothetical protein [Lentilactobacillus buchneri]MCI2028119.1 hypothetical protein [Lentilactobacillus buchneri]
MRKEKFDMDIVNNFFKHDYHDRGMAKWQGFFLSDHTAALKKQKAKEAQQQIIEPKTSADHRGNNKHPCKGLPSKANSYHST